jgi:hypothetical protein
MKSLPVAIDDPVHAAILGYAKMGFASIAQFQQRTSLGGLGRVQHDEFRRAAYLAFWISRAPVAIGRIDGKCTQRQQCRREKHH